MKAFHVPAIVLALALGVLAYFWDWNWFRVPVEHYIAAQTGRAVTLGSLDVKLRPTTIVILKDLNVANAPWGHGPHLAQIGAIEVSVRWTAFFYGNHADRLVLRNFDVSLERRADNAVNWKIGTKPDVGSGLPIKTIWLDNGIIHYLDAKEEIRAEFKGEAVHDEGVGPAEAPEAPVPNRAERSEDAARATHPRPASLAPSVDTRSPEGTAADSTRFATHITFSGTYHNAPFSGKFDAGDILGEDEMFPVRLLLNAGATTAHAFGRSNTDLSRIDVALRMAGPTMANLYPFLLLPLPASPPYHVQGHLLRDGGNYAYTGFSGQIGETDLRGDASYTTVAHRPLLKVDIHSNVLSFADLGPLVGIHGTPSASGATGSDQRAPAVAVTGRSKAVESATSAQARALEGADSPDRRVLPSAAFSAEKLQAIDAEATLTADQLRMPHPFALESMFVQLHLNDGVMQLRPLKFGFAGGTLTSLVTMDAKSEPLHATIDAELRQARISRLFPTNGYLQSADGRIGARMKLAGTGDSVATLLGTSNGTASFASSGGTISRTMLQIIDLDGGRLVGSKIFGDEESPMRCAIAKFDVKNGVATLNPLVLDTTETQIQGDGTLDFGTEKINVVFHPQPKNRSIFVARTPFDIGGTFRHPTLTVEKPPIALRGAAMVALGLLTPLAALLPLIETAPGSDANCATLLAAVAPGVREENAASGPPAKHTAERSAPRR